MTSRAVEFLEVNAVLEARPSRALDDPAAGRSDVETAGHPQDRLTRDLLEFSPVSIRGPEQRDVLGSLGVRQADDAGGPVRGAERVRDGELLQAQHPAAAPRELVDRGAAHPAHADHDDVVHDSLSLLSGALRCA